MNKFIKKVGGFLSGAKQKAVGFVSSFNRISGVEDYFDTLNLRTYQDSLYLFIGVSMIRETVSGMDLELYKIKNKDGDVEEIYDDPVLELLERPNYRQTKKEFWKLAVAYYLLAGETFWYLQKEEKSKAPMSMVNLRPDHVEIILSADKKEIIAYEYTQNDGTVIKIPADDILHIKNIDPINPARGIGVIRPASQRIITEKEASNYQADTFRAQGRPDVAIFLETDPEEDEIEEARLKWTKTFGNKGQSQASFLGANVKSLQVLGTSPQEMGYIGTMNFLRDDILASLRIPKAMITSDDVNLANSKTARINYIKEACQPVLDTFLDIINNKYLVDQDQEKFVTYETGVEEDRELLLKEATELKKSGIISQNEARGLLNYEEVENGDTFTESSLNTFQLSMKKARLRKQAIKHLKKRKILTKKFKAIEAVEIMLTEEAKSKEVKRERNSVFHTTEMKEKYIKAFNEKIDRKAEMFRETIDVYNQGLEKRIMKQMEDFGINQNNIFDVSSEISTAKKIFVPLMKNMFEKAGQDTLDSVADGFSTKASEHFYSVEELLKQLEQRSEFFIISMLDTDFKELKAIIIAGLADGKGVAELGRDLRKYFDNMSVSRAKTIARTETGRLISQATNEAYRQSEVVTGKEWLTSHDSKVRDNSGTVNDHVVNDGVIVGTEGTFPNGEKYPGELTINCRCALAPAV